MMTNANLRYTYLYFRQYRLNTRNTIPNRIPMDAAVEKTTNSSKGMIRVFGCLSNWSDGTRPSQSNTQKIKQLKCRFRSCSVSILNQSTENCKIVNMNQQSLQIIHQHLLSSAESCRLVTSQLSQQCVVLVRSVHTLDVVHNIQKNFCALVILTLSLKIACLNSYSFSVPGFHSVSLVALNNSNLSSFVKC